MLVLYSFGVFQMWLLINILTQYSPERNFMRCNSTESTIIKDTGAVHLYYGYNHDIFTMLSNIEQQSGVRYPGFTAHNPDMRWIPQAKGKVGPFIPSQPCQCLPFHLLSCFGQFNVLEIDTFLGLVL